MLVGDEMNLRKVNKSDHSCEETIAEFVTQIRDTVHRVTDPKIDAVVTLLPTLASADAIKIFDALIDSENLELVFASLRATENTASPQAAEILARVVAVTSEKLPREVKKDVSAAFIQAPIFVAEILRRIGDDVPRAKLASIIVSDAPSLPFVCDVMQCVAGSIVRRPVFTPEIEMRLQQQLADRIDRYFSSDETPIYLRDRENAATYLRVLLKAGRGDSVRTYLTASLTSRPESVCEFLWTIFPNKAHDLRTGKMGLIRILPQQYDFLSSVIDPTFVADLAQIRIRNLPDTIATPDSQSEWDVAHLRQFLAFYRSLKLPKS